MTCTARSAELSSAMKPLGISTWGVRIDPSRAIVNRTVVDLEVPESVLGERRKTVRVLGALDQRGWLGVYQRTVAPVHEGAVLKGP